MTLLVNAIPEYRAQFQCGPNIVLPAFMSLVEYRRSSGIDTAIAAFRLRYRLSPLASPREVVTAFEKRFFCPSTRQCLLQPQDFTAAAFLLGDQYCIEFGWKWRAVSWDGERFAFCVLVPDHAWGICPLLWLQECRDGKTANFLLNFNLTRAGDYPDSRRDAAWLVH